MARKWTHTSAFAYFGTAPNNVQWSWSARSADGKTVVVTLWQDHIKGREGSTICGHDSFEPSVRKRPGFRELMKNLAWARDHCGGRFHVIVAIARDRNADPRSIAECFPSPIVMRITSLNIETGAYTAESVSSLPPRTPKTGDKR